MSPRSQGLGDAAGNLLAIELFADLQDHQLDWLAARVRSLTLADGEVLFREDDPAALFYVLIAGGLVVTRQVGGRRQVVHACASAGSRPAAGTDHQFIGELPLLIGGSHTVSATAVGHTEIISISRSTFFAMMERCPQVCRVLLPAVARRIRLYEAGVDPVAPGPQPGPLAAGLAGEPVDLAAALTGAVVALRRGVADLDERSAGWGALASAAERALVADLRSRAIEHPPDPDGRAPAAPPLPPAQACGQVEQAVGQGGHGVGIAQDVGQDVGQGGHGVGIAQDVGQDVGQGGQGVGIARDVRQDVGQDVAVREWLAARELDGAPEWAPLLAGHGVSVDLLAGLGRQVRADVLAAAVGYLASCLRVHALIEEVGEAGRRVESLVEAGRARADPAGAE